MADIGGTCCGKQTEQSQKLMYNTVQCIEHHTWLVSHLSVKLYVVFKCSRKASSNAGIWVPRWHSFSCASSPCCDSVNKQPRRRPLVRLNHWTEQTCTHTPLRSDTWRNALLVLTLYHPPSQKSTVYGRWKKTSLTAKLLGRATLILRY